jgi:hypothetical protein
VAARRPYRKDEDESWAALKGLGWAVGASLIGVSVVISLAVLAGAWAIGIASTVLLLAAGLLAAAQARRTHETGLSASGIPLRTLMRAGEAAAIGLWVSGCIGSAVALMSISVWAGYLFLFLLFVGGAKTYEWVRFRK